MIRVNRAVDIAYHYIARGIAQLPRRVLRARTVLGKLYGLGCSIPQQI